MNIVAVDPGRRLHPLNRMLFGQNAEWVWFNEPGLWDGERLGDQLVEATRSLAVSSLRFPGGGHGDWYDWRDAVGAERRGVYNPFTRDRAHPRFGTDEFLDLCRRAGCSPWMQTNPAGLSAEDTAAWAEYCREAGTEVPHWEVGNEIYLVPPDQPDHHEAAIAMPPAVYAERARQHVLALREVSPEALIGTIGGQWTYHRRLMGPPLDWDDVTLPLVGDVIDYLAVHTVYCPVVFEPQWFEEATPESVRDTFLAAAAAPEFVAENIAANLDSLDHLVPGRRLPLAVTEWLPLFGIAGDASDYTGALGAALYTSGVFHAFAREPRVLAAHFMAFLQPQFGACLFMGEGRLIRSVHAEVFSLYGRTLGDTLVACDVTSADTFDAPAVGLLGARSAVPTVDALATTSGSGTQVVLVNRDLDESRTVRLDVAGAGEWWRGAQAEQLAGRYAEANTPVIGRSITRRPDGEALRAAPVAVDGPALTLPPCSITAVSFAR